MAYKSKYEIFVDIEDKLKTSKSNSQKVELIKKIITDFHYTDYYTKDDLEYTIFSLLGTWKGQNKIINSFFIKELPFLKIQAKKYEVKRKEAVSEGGKYIHEIITNKFIDFLIFQNNSYRKQILTEGSINFYNDKNIPLKTLATFIDKNPGIEFLLWECFKDFDEYMIIKLIYEKKIKLYNLKSVVKFTMSVNETTQYYYELLQYKYSRSKIRDTIINCFNGEKSKKKAKAYRVRKLR